MNAQQMTQGVSSKTIEPHGGALVDREVSSEVKNRIEDSGDYQAITLDTRRLCDLNLLGNGGYSPLKGFLGEKDYQTVLSDMRLSDGTVWPLPVVLPVSEEEWNEVTPTEDLLLENSDGERVGILENPEPFTRDLEKEAQAVYGTDDPDHDGVSRLLGESSYLLGGEVKVFPDLELPIPGASRAQSPRELRNTFGELGWKQIVGFQTRNPIHRAHEYLMKCALEISDGLLVHPLVGPTRSEDVPAEVRLECYKAILNHHFPDDRTVLSTYPAPMWYGGPKEALLHAIVRQNHGCTHFIVGRDHAGVGDYYGTYEAQEMFHQFTNEDVGVTILPFDFAFYCEVCETFASEKTCPHDNSNHLYLSGTKVREKLRNGESLPRTFTRKKVEDILQSHYSSATE